MNEPKKEPIKTYEKTISHEGKSLKIILSVYDEAIIKTEAIQLFSKFVIMDGIFEWGHGLFAGIIPEDKAENTLDQIAAEPNKYKNP